MFDKPYPYLFRTRTRVLVNEDLGASVLAELRARSMEGRIINGPRGFSYCGSEPRNLSIIEITKGTTSAIEHFFQLPLINRFWE
jgi:hypothetical protein